MRARLADERGFTLVELLATLVVSMIVLFALFGLVDTATRRQSVATDRIDANDRGRAAMDIVGQQLRSRVCLARNSGSIVAATPTQIEFYSSLGLTAESSTVSQVLVIQRRRLTYRPAPNSDIVEERWTSTPPALPAASSTTPTKKRTLLTSVQLSTAANGSTIPFLSYSALSDTLGAPLATPLALPATLTAANISAQTQTRLRIDVSFAAKGKVAGVSTPLQNQIIDRSPGCYFGS